MLIRPETPRDNVAVRHVNECAFGRPNEAVLVDRIRRTPYAAVSLVAETEGRVVGHILFTNVTITSATGPSPAVALGPMAVLPKDQRKGVGSALVRAGLDACRRAGYALVFVLGHPDFYPRFGFVPAPPKGLTCLWPVPENVFMVGELTLDALRGRHGLVRYAPAFE
ncbi:MAG: N-acetyltransferase, partial [Planctomycetota bacterium]